MEAKITFVKDNGNFNVQVEFPDRTVWLSEAEYKAFLKAIMTTRSEVR